MSTPAKVMRRWYDGFHRGVSKDRLTPYFRASQLCRELYKKSGDEALKHTLDSMI